MFCTFGNLSRVFPGLLFYLINKLDVKTREYQVMCLESMLRAYWAWVSVPGIYIERLSGLSGMAVIKIVKV